MNTKNMMDPYLGRYRTKLSDEEKKKILSAIETIMINDGPDGHTDGSGIIAEYVYYMLEMPNNGENFIELYNKQVAEYNEDAKKWKAWHITRKEFIEP